MNLDVLLVACLTYFVHRDHSNAAIHCGPVRYSPLTFRLAETVAEMFPDMANTDPDVRAVLDHVGQYEEDQGR